MTKAASETPIDTTAKVADGGLRDRPPVHHRRAPIRSTRSSGRRATRSSATPRLPPSSSATSSSRSTWSQNATNIVAQKYFRGPLGSPERERSVKQMIGRVAGTIAGWGREGGYFASAADADAFEAELDPHPPPPEGRLQLARLVQRRLRGAPAVLGLLHPQRRGHDGVDPRLEHQGGHDLPRRLRLRASTSRTSAARSSSSARAASPPARSASCAAPTPGPARSSPAARPAARRRWSCSTSTIRTSRTSSGARPRRRRRPPRSATPASTCRSTVTASPRSSTRTPTTRSASPTSSWRPSRPAPTGT